MWYANNKIRYEDVCDCTVIPQRDSQTETERVKIKQLQVVTRAVSTILPFYP